jgi:hypothetical protein
MKPVDTGPPARKKAARRKRIPNRDAKTQKVYGANVAKIDTFSNSDPSRQLIRCQDDVLLYELAQGRARSYEVVSPIGECWRCSLRYQAESKWARLLAKTKGGAR